MGRMHSQRLIITSLLLITALSLFGSVSGHQAIAATQYGSYRSQAAIHASQNSMSLDQLNSTITTTIPSTSPTSATSTVSTASSSQITTVPTTTTTVSQSSAVTSTSVATRTTSALVSTTTSS